MYKTLISTINDKGSRSERMDTTVPSVRGIFGKNLQFIASHLIPGDSNQIKDALINDVFFLEHPRFLSVFHPLLNEQLANRCDHQLNKEISMKFDLGKSITRSQALVFNERTLALCAWEGNGSAVRMP